MAQILKQEREAVEAEECQLKEPRARLAQAEQKEVLATIAKSGLLKLDGARLDALMKRIKTLGIDEVQKRLADQT